MQALNGNLIMHHQQNDQHMDDALRKTPHLTLKGTKSPTHLSVKAGSIEDFSEETQGIGTNYMSERIEKTLQKYSKKEIMKSATTTNSSANKQPTRNAGLFNGPISQSSLNV